LITVSLLSVLLIAGGLAGWWRTGLARDYAQDEFLRTARLLAESVNLQRLAVLSGSVSDVNRPEFRRLKEQFHSVLPVLPGGTSISLLGRGPDGGALFLLDARASAAEHGPGDVWKPAHQASLLAFEEMRETVSVRIISSFETAAPVLSALVPVVEVKSRRVLAVLLLETDAALWRKDVLSAGFVSWGAALLLALLVFLGRCFLINPRISQACPLFLRKYAEAAWVAIFSSILVLAIAWHVDGQDMQSRFQSFAVLSDLQSSALIASLKEFRDYRLEGLGSFFESSEFVDPEEFAAYTRHLSSIPEIEAVLWILPSPSRGGIASSAGNERAEAPLSSLSFPVTYSDPVSNRLFPPGFDMASVPSFVRGMKTAGMTGMITASEPENFCTGGASCCSILFRPVYSLPENDSSGFVAFVLNLETMLRSAMSVEKAGKRVLNADLWRIFPDGRRSPLASLSPRSGAEDGNGAEFASIRPFFIFGLAFALEIRPGEGFLATHRRQAGMIALFSGLLVTAVLSLLTGLFVNRRSMLQRLVAQRTVALAESELNFRKIAHLYRSIAEGVVVTDAGGVIEDCNPALEELTGYSLEEMRGKRFDMFSARENQIDLESFPEGLSENGSWQGELLNRRKDGAAYPVWLTFTAVADPSGKVTHYSGVMRHIGGIKSEQERLNRMAYHDFLTGLPNRALLSDRLEMALARAKREEEVVVLVFMDLDGFKEINDAFGHETGDRLLVETGRRLSGAFREEDTVARIGGDEFVLLFEGRGGQQDVDTLLERLHALFREPFSLGERTVSVSSSFGVALFPSDGEDARSLLEAADRDMYEEKAAKKRRIADSSG
jgi:diguanylate cyclase (GGDEF)-like protein/PAS domain S-box-containing protein